MKTKLLNKTYMPPKESVVHHWRVIDAQDKVFGRVVAKVATYLMGKLKPIYTSHVDCGDFVVILNAAGFKVTGDKRVQKYKFHYTGYPGGDRYENFGKLLAEKPEKAVFLAVRGMLPKSRLGKKLITRLRVYTGTEHKHSAQKLEPITLL